MSDSPLLDEHLLALRAAGDDADDPHAALATRLRLRRSLEVGHRIRRQLISAGAAIAILLLGTASWALVTGNLPRLWPRPHDEPAVTPPDLRPRTAPTRPTPVEHAVPAPLEPAPIEPLTVAPPPPPPHPVVRHPAVAPAPQPAAPQPAAPTPTELLYRRAHELHFRGTDHAAALAAWDDYLAAEPDGRFAIEARYNRALCLIRLGRLAEAKAALEPFAHGEVEPAGYRQEEAAALIDRIAQIGLNE